LLVLLYVIFRPAGKAFPDPCPHCLRDSLRFPRLPPGKALSFQPAEKTAGP